MFLPLIALAAWFTVISGQHVVVPDGLESKTNLQITRTANVALRPQLKKLNRAPLTSLHTLVLEVLPNNLDTLDDILYDVSDPVSSNYGKYWSFEMLKQYTFNEQAHQFLASFFALNGVTIEKETANGDYLFVTASMQYWEELLKAEFYSYCMTENDVCDGNTFYRSREYSLPQYLSEHVSAVFNIIDFPMKMRSEAQYHSAPLQSSESSESTHGRKLQFANGYVYPQFFNAYYNIHSSIVGDNSVSQAIFASLNQSTSPSDLSYFQSHYSLPQYPLTADVGGHVFDSACAYQDGDNCGEANLDVQWIMSVAQQAPTTYYYWDDTLYTDDAFWVSWITAIASMQNPSDVYSVSYGQPEIGIDQSIMNSFNYQAQKLGILGTTVLVSSGDNGIQSTITNPQYKCVGYFTEFPTSSQYVTSVGATMGPEAGKPEVACQNSNGSYPSVALITSGGGFSNFNARPYWQETAVHAYFHNVTSQPVQSYTFPFNTTGRGYPDVSLLGHNYYVAQNKQMTLADGTSASAPAMAGIVTLANFNRVKAGKPTLGFINPFLYQYRNRFARDITVGDNSCYGFTVNHMTGNLTALCCPQFGFSTSTGWDPVTGIGSVDVNSFINAALDVVTATATAEPALQPTFEPTSEYSLEPTMEFTEEPTMEFTEEPTMEFTEEPTMEFTEEPTEAPTGNPLTLYPTQALNENSTVRVVFGAGQVLQGISNITYNLDYTLNTLVMLKSIASCMTGIYPNNITQYAIEGISSNSEMQVQYRRRKLQGSSPPMLVATYLVVDNRTDANYDTLSNELTTCVNSLQFDRILQANAVAAGATSLQHVTCIYVSTDVIENNVPSASPSAVPSMMPTDAPTLTPNAVSQEPTATPTEVPSVTPSAEPTIAPSAMPSAAPTEMPSAMPSAAPTEMPTAMPTVMSSAMPTVAPTEMPTEVPTVMPTAMPSATPTEMPTAMPTVMPSAMPTVAPTEMPSAMPTVMPTAMPSTMPTVMPSAMPTAAPSEMPTASPTVMPTAMPSVMPSVMPTTAPTVMPSAAPTVSPTAGPTAVPSMMPTVMPTAVPTTAPTAIPSPTPTIRPSLSPSVSPAPTATIMVQFAAAQTIDGISADTYNSDVSLYNSVLQQSIAGCMTGIEPDDITNLAVKPAGSRRRLLTAEDITVVVQLRSSPAVTTATATDNEDHRRLQSNAISTSYIVSSTNPSLSYTDLSNQLATAVSSGGFNTLLNTNAASAGATALVGCSSTSVSTVDATDGGSSSKNGLSGGAIAGIVIGVLVGVGLIAGAVFYVFFYGSSSQSNGSVVTSSRSGGKATFTQTNEIDRMYDNPLAQNSMASPVKGKQTNDNDLL